MIPLMKTRIVLLTLTLFAACALHANDRVVPLTKRSNLIKNAQAMQDVSDPELVAELDSVRYPFEFAPAPKKVVVKTPTGPEPEPEPERVITSQEVLDEFTSRLKATGAIIKDGRGVLILAGGKQLIEGRTYRVNYEGKPFDIVLSAVTSDSYTLSLDNDSVTRKFDSDAGRGVTRD